MRTYHGLELPEQDNIEVALRLAREKLAGVDPADAARRLACTLVENDGKKALCFHFMGAPITVALPEGTARYDGGGPVPDFLLVLVLHYMISQGRGLKNEPISFVQVPSGSFYEEPFHRRTKKQLLHVFGEQVELFTKAAASLGWEPAAQGDTGAVALPFPQVPITFVLYGQDEEFEPDAQILFDASIPEFLSTEDIAMVSGLLVGGVCKAAAKITDGEAP